MTNFSLFYKFYKQNFLPNFFFFFFFISLFHFFFIFKNYFYIFYSFFIFLYFFHIFIFHILMFNPVIKTNFHTDIYKPTDISIWKRISNKVKWLVSTCCYEINQCWINVHLLTCLIRLDIPTDDIAATSITGKKNIVKKMNSNQ